MQITVSAGRGGRVKATLRSGCKIRQLFALCKSRVWLSSEKRNAWPRAERLGDTCSREQQLRNSAGLGEYSRPGYRTSLRKSH